MEEDDHAQSHDENQRTPAAQQCRAMEKKGRRARRGGRVTHTCRRHDLMESLYQVRRLMGGVLLKGKRRRLVNLTYNQK
jgi:hypothetical protein